MTMLFFSLWFGDLQPLFEVIILTLPMYGFVWVASDLTYSSLKVKNIIEGQEVYVLSGTSFLSPISLRHLMSTELVPGPCLACRDRNTWGRLSEVLCPQPSPQKTE